MQFMIVENREVWWPVSVKRGVDGGKVETMTFSMKFKIFDVDDSRVILQDAQKLFVPNEGEEPKNSSDLAALIARMTTDWKDVTGPDNTPLPFNQDNLVKAMKMPNAFMSVLDAYRACASGDAGSRSGN